MNYVKRKRAERKRAKIKKCLIRWFVFAILCGMVSGFFIGRVSAMDESKPIPKSPEIISPEISEEIIPTMLQNSKTEFKNQ